MSFPHLVRMELQHRPSAFMAIRLHTGPFRNSMADWMRRLTIWTLVLALHLAVLVSCTTRKGVVVHRVSGKQGMTQVATVKEDRLRAMNGVGLVCQNKYTGVGVRFEPGSNLITEIAPGGPADRAGVQLGDVLLNPFFAVGALGASVEFLVRRGNASLNFKAKVEEICHQN